MMLARRLVLFVALLVGSLGPANATPPNVITRAVYEEATTRYDHGILGDAIEWGALRLTVDMCMDCETSQVRDFVIRLPQNRVFEDTEPRLVEITGDESPEVMVVETDINKGARLAFYTEEGLLVATPFIGRTHRWLAPVGVVDIDGDGQVEIAYIDRPHLAKMLRLWQFSDGKLTEFVHFAPVTNHRIGDSEISGGIRTCTGRPEYILAAADWSTIHRVFWLGRHLTMLEIGPNTGPAAFNRALNCTD